MTDRKSQVTSLTNKFKGSFYVLDNQGRHKKTWSVYFQYYEEGKRKKKIVPRELFHHFGFKPDGTVEQARIRVKRLNKERSMNPRAFLGAHKRVKTELKEDDVFFPEAYLEEFLEYLYERVHGGEGRTQKVELHFKVAQRLVRDTKLLPQEYSLRSAKIYKWFAAEQYSLNYIHQILRALNLWGQFYSQKNNLYFEPIAKPRGRARTNINVQNTKSAGKRHESKPLSPKQLKMAKPNLNPEHYNWLFISVWFGLRPIEIDNLTDEKYFSISGTARKKILSVYQSKLADLEEEKRWKNIPILHPEQKEALKIIESGEFKRPHPKTVQSKIAEGITLYGGRKGFTELMLSLGHDFFETSNWLGHTSIERTYKSYYGDLGKKS